MSLHLRRLYVGAKPNGWTTDWNGFGERFTFIHGANGSGKTPLIKALIFALGVPIEIPPEISTMCREVQLEFETHDGLWRLTRPIDGSFRMSAQRLGGDNAVIDFTTEKDFSAWLLPQIGIKPPTLASRSNSKTSVYIGALIPVVWTDQDRGWTTIYAPVHGQNFIQDQQQEMFRLVLGLTPKKAFDQREEYETRKKELATLDERIAFRRLGLERERQYLDSTARPLDDLRADRIVTIKELQALSSTLDSAATTVSSYEVQIRQQERVCQSLEASLTTLERQTRRLEVIQSELDAEIEILSSNDTAADLFRTFCGKDNCNLFRDSRLSYGKRLLYLKDQIKDLSTTQTGLGADQDRMKAELSKERDKLNETAQQRQAALEKSGVDRLTATIENLSKRLAEVEVAIARREHYQTELGKLNELIDSRNRLEAQVKALKPGKSRGDSRADQVRLDLAKRLGEWLQQLGTPNLGGSVEVNEEFEPVIDGQRFHAGSSHSGSTRTRIVLAFRAAILQTSLENGGVHPAVMIFDAPKQQEINPNDLKNYFIKLRMLCDAFQNRTQAVVAISDEILPIGNEDARWTPKFTIAGKSRFFGPTPEFRSS